MISASTRILIVDEHPVIVSGLARLIGSESGWALAAAVSSCEQALAELERAGVDLVVLEPGIGGMDGLARLAEIAGRARVLCFSALGEDLLAERVLREGARGFVMKTSSGDELLAAIRTVLGGGIALSEAVRSRVIGRIAGVAADGRAAGLGVLNNRELQIVHLLGASRSSREIAERMHVSEKTIATHRVRIREKLCLRSSGELVRVAARWVEQEALS